jgi:hypothetical protein
VDLLLVSDWTWRFEFFERGYWDFRSGALQGMSSGPKHLANFGLAFSLGFHLNHPVAAENFFGFGEGTVADLGFASREGNARAHCGWLETVEREPDAGFFATLRCTSSSRTRFWYLASRQQLLFRTPWESSASSNASWCHFVFKIRGRASDPIELIYFLFLL